MASAFKEIKTSVAATFGAATATVTGISRIITTVADSSSDAIAPTMGIITDVAQTGRGYTSDLLAETLADNKISEALRDFKLKAFEEAMEDTEVQAKLKARAAADIMERLFD